jgi:hypothetical protein
MQNLKKKCGASNKMLRDIEKAILEETAYAEESLHGIIFGFLKHGICKEPAEVIDPILNLLAASRLKMYYQSGWSGDPYLDITSIPLPSLKEYLLAYIEKHKAEFDRQYSEGGGGFFIKSVD